MADSTRDVEHQVFILDEAEEELDWGDEDEDALSAPDLLVREEQERARQKAESVKLKDRSECTSLQPPEPPAPVLHLGNAGTSHPALPSLPVPPSSPHPSPAPPEARLTSLALPAYPPPTESPGDIAPAAPKAKAPAPTPPAHTQSSEGSGEVSLAAPEVKSYPVTATLSHPPPLHAPSPEGSRDVFLPAPQVKLIAPAPQAQSPSSGTDGDLSIPAPESQLLVLAPQYPSSGTYGDLSIPAPESQLLVLAPAPSMEGSGNVSRAAQDNSFLMDVDPPQCEDPLSENGEGDIPMAKQTSGKVKVVIDDHEDSADEFESEHNISDMTNEQHELAKWIKEHNIPILGPFPYHVYHVRCKRGSERAIVECINKDIACGTVSLNLIRAAFISQFPGGFYLQAHSMLPGNVPLALYLNLFPNVIHPCGKKFSLREEWDQLRLGMPLHTLVDDLSGTEDSKRMFYGNNFQPGTWVVPTKGLYQGDTGLVVFDNFNEINEETECLVLLIPRAKFPESHPLNTSNSPLHPTNPSSRRKVVPQSAADNVDIEITPSDRQSQFRLPDFEGAGYLLPIEPCHEPPFQKRFIFDRLVLRGGLALVPHKFGDLKIAESIDDGLLRTFLQYPNADVLPSRLLPSLSWSFTSGETVIYVPEGTELQDVVKGDEGVIQRDGSLECEVLFSRNQVNISVLKRHLRKTWRLAQVVELSPHTPEVVLRKREQLGYSGVSTLHEDHFMPAGQTGIITKVRLDEVDVWITGINSICTIHPNSVREVVESSVSPGLKSRFQPRLSNVGATIALKPSLLGIQRYGNLNQKADLAKIADSFISHEVNRFDLRRGEYRVQNRSTAMTSMLTSIDQMSSFLNPTIPSTLFGYVVTEGVVPRTEYTGQIPWMHVEVKPISGE
ncbi:hypothetical protein DFJ43DRAFT_1044516 [Lentinula guzmanii]|uniref:Uncharacterized protein n=1 Tax=Lentinula guzmanii TaxID=2804957 RepID=A0AA38JCW0_9AGAR|nr:hypothetical protein DFJ43DRAFT_1044516 [Lentinula guzmanii]